MPRILTVALLLALTPSLSEARVVRLRIEKEVSKTKSQRLDWAGLLVANKAKRRVKRMTNNE